MNPQQPGGPPSPGSSDETDAQADTPGEAAEAGDLPVPGEPPAAMPPSGPAEQPGAQAAAAHGPTAHDPPGHYPAAPEAPHTRATPDPHGAAPPSGTATTIQAGWYPDPQNGRHQRYWDGAGWTFHTAPRQDLGRKSTPASAPTGSSPAATGTTSRLSRGAWAGVVAGVVLLVALAVFAGQQLFGGGPQALPNVTLDPPSDSDDEFFASDATNDSDDPDGAGDPGDDAGATRIDGEEFTAGEDVEGSFDTGEEWAANVVVEEDALILFDATPDSFSDLTMQIWTADDELLVDNDDRGDLSEFGGARLDPLITADLPAGNYTIVVGTYNDAESADFTLVTAIPPVLAGPQEELEVEQDGLAGRTVEIADDGDYTITATSDLGELSMVVIDSADDYPYSAESTTSGAEWAGSLSAGRHLLLIADSDRRAFDLTLDIDGT